MFDLEVEWRSFWVTVTCSPRNNDFKTGGYLEHDFTTISSEIHTFWTSATNRYMHQQTRDTVSRAQHTTQKKVIDLWSGFWTCGSIVWKWVERQSAFHPSQVSVGIRRGHYDRSYLVMIEARQNWKDLCILRRQRLMSCGRRCGIKLIRCHPTQLRCITEAIIRRERSRQDSLSTQELSMLSEKLETASWRTEQMSTQINVDVSLLLDSAVHSVMQDLLDVNKLMRSQCRRVRSTV